MTDTPSLFLFLSTFIITPFLVSSVQRQNYLAFFLRTTIPGNYHKGKYSAVFIISLCTNVL